MSVLKIWHRIFLEERPSIGLSFFRIFVALTTGLHVIPSFFHLKDNYLSGAFKTLNPMFFTNGVLDAVQKSPDWLVIAFVAVFLLTWFCFLIGFYAQISCILMTVACYYFYALNDFHIGTLSWDILLVTLFLMCVTPYHGDYFSMDALRKGDPLAYKRPRPIFLQRLLQLQIASTFFYTALYKITAQGNWIKGNPIYVLMNYPPSGVTKNFLLKEWMAVHPGFCYWMGIFIIAMELSLSFWLFYPKTRRSAIIAGFIFHITLILTLDVPAIFLFLFPTQLLLFIDPQAIVQWVEEKRKGIYPLKVIYDGKCGFCLSSVKQLQVMDLFGRLTFEGTLEHISEVKLIEGDKEFSGFFAFRRLCWHLPMLYPLLMLVYLPGVSFLGQWCYAWIAQNRFFFHRSHMCTDHQCFRKS